MLNHHQQLLGYLPFDPQWTGAIALVSLATFLLSLILIPWIVARLPADYFVYENRPVSNAQAIHPSLYFSLKVLRNILAGLLGVCT